MRRYVYMHLYFAQLTHWVLSGASGQGEHSLVAVLVDHLIFSSSPLLTIRYYNLLVNVLSCVQLAHLINKVFIALTGIRHFFRQYSDSYVMYISITVTFYATLGKIWRKFVQKHWKFKHFCKSHTSPITCFASCTIHNLWKNKYFIFFLFLEIHLFH
jgi:hypothetical protein